MVFRHPTEMKMHPTPKDLTGTRARSVDEMMTTMAMDRTAVGAMTTMATNMEKARNIDKKAATAKGVMAKEVKDPAA